MGAPAAAQPGAVVSAPALPSLSAPTPRSALAIPRTLVRAALWGFGCEPGLQRSLPCAETPPPTPTAQQPASARYGTPTLPRVRHESHGDFGGFLDIEILASRRLSAGPQLSWLTPDSSREDVPRLRIVTPGWGVRYTSTGADVSFGIGAGTRFMLVAQSAPVFDTLAPEARFELRLP